MDVRRLAQNSIIALAVAALSIATFKQFLFFPNVSVVVSCAVLAFIFYHALTSRRPIGWTEIVLSLVVLTWMTIDLILPDKLIQRVGLIEMIILFTGGAIAFFYKPALWGLKMKGLRERALIKPLAISFCWSFLTFLLPYWLIQAPHESALSGFMERITFIIPLAIMSDYFDVEQEPQLNTIPRKFGLPFTRILVVLLLLLHMLILLWQEIPGYMVLPDFIACGLIIFSRQGYSFTKVMAVESVLLLHGLMMII